LEALILRKIKAKTVSKESLIKSLGVRQDSQERSFMEKEDPSG
jgi:hypothetical protein